MEWLDEMVEAVPPRSRKLAKRYAKELRFMDSKLEEMREYLEGTELVIPYDHGGGQKGLRANPAYAEYEKLFAAFNRGIKAILELMPEEQATEAKAKVSAFKSRVKAASA